MASSLLSSREEPFTLGSVGIFSYSSCCSWALTLACAAAISYCAHVAYTYVTVHWPRQKVLDDKVQYKIAAEKRRTQRAWEVYTVVDRAKDTEGGGGTLWLMRRAKGGVGGILVDTPNEIEVVGGAQKEFTRALRMQGSSTIFELLPNHG